MSGGVKRYRIRLEARDGAELQRAIGHRIEPEGMWMKLAEPPALDTLAEVIVHFSDEREALVGSGWVSEHREAETFFELEWEDRAEPGLLERLFSSTPDARPALTLDQLESPDEVPLVPSASPQASGTRLHPDLVWDVAKTSAASVGPGPITAPGTEDLEALDPDTLADPEAGEPTRLDLPAMAPAAEGVAIDVGCSVVEVATARGGEARRRDGEAPFPALVGLSEYGELVTGKTAWELQQRSPDRVVTEIKRFVGLPSEAPIVRRMASHLSWQLVEGPEGRAAALLDGRVFPLEHLLARLIEDAVGGAPGPAAVVVPSWYGPRQRAAMVASAAQAGVEAQLVLGCNLAAVAHAFPEGSERLQRVLAIDLGAGTLDVALVEVEERELGVLACGGHALLGGVEFDAAVAQLLMDAMDHRGERPPGPTLSVSELLGTAEGGKFALDEVSRVQLAVSRSQAEIEVARGDAEQLWGTLIDKAVSVAKDVLLRSGLGQGAVDGVLLSGGQVRSPYVVRRLEDVFRRPCRVADTPGAAVLGAARLVTGADIGIMDALPCALVIERPHGEAVPLVGRDAPFPAFGAATVELTPEEPAALRLREGEKPHAGSAVPHGLLRLESLPEHRAQPIGLEVQVTVSADGQVGLEVVRSDTGTEVSTRLDPDVRAGSRPPESSQPAVAETEGDSGGGGFLDWVRRKLLG